jgi:hypothetical protein
MTPKPKPAAGLYKRKPGLRAVAASLPAVTRRLYKRRGFAQSDILTQWPAIVGDVLAGYCVPERVNWPRDPERPDGATLRIRVASAWAPQLAHLEPIVLDRVNSYFGYKAVAKLALVHGRVRPPEKVKPIRRRPLTAEEAGKLDALLADIDDPDLRAALRQLGGTIVATAESADDHASSG